MDKKLTNLIIIFILAFSLFISFLIFKEPIATFTRAKEESLPSKENSLIFAWPLTVKANGQDKAEINVFIRNNKNVPLANKTVILQTSLGKFANNQQLTDKTGKATFALTSDTSGIAQITAFTENNLELKEKITIKFE